MCTPSELSRATAVEVDQRVSNAAMERDSALQEAQELAERLENVERERDGLQMDLETAQIQAEELQFQLDELSNRYNTVTLVMFTQHGLNQSHTPTPHVCRILRDCIHHPM